MRAGVLACAQVGLGCCANEGHVVPHRSAGAPKPKNIRGWDAVRTARRRRAARTIRVLAREKGETATNVPVALPPWAAIPSMVQFAGDVVTFKSRPGPTPMESVCTPGRSKLGSCM